MTNMGDGRRKRLHARAARRAAAAKPAPKRAAAPADASRRNSTMTVHQRLREAILSGEIAPGSWLSQVQIANNYRVSRGPLREAVRLLQQEGLVEVEANQRNRVAAFSIADLEQLYALRIVSESLALRISIPQFSEDDLRTIDRFLVGMETTPPTDVETWRQMHRGFHFALVSRSGERLTGMIRQLYDFCERYRRVYVFPETHSWLMAPAEHKEIADACRLRDANLAAERLGRHLSRTALTMLMMISPEYDPAAIRASLQSVVGRSMSNPSQVQ